MGLQGYFDSSHFKEVCVRCKKVYFACECKQCKKEVFYGLCDECDEIVRKSEWINKPFYNNKRKTEWL